MSQRRCRKWGVVTTIFGPHPSEAIRRFLYRKNRWCVVVVGDAGKPKVRKKGWITGILMHIIDFYKTIKFTNKL